MPFDVRFELFEPEHLYAFEKIGSGLVVLTMHSLPQAIIHPDTGKKIFMPFRMSGNLPGLVLNCER